MAVSKEFHNKKIAIYGVGKSGLSSAEILTQKKAKIFCWDDDRKTRSKLKTSKYNVSKFWLNKYYPMDYIVISPGIDIDKSRIKKFLKKNKEKIITDLDIFFRLNKNISIIAITGTNGKSTTCKIIQKILNEAGYNVKVGGNIGNPVLSLKKASKKNIYIFEVSSYQLQYSSLFRSQHAAILNISPDHLDRHKNIKKYIQTKLKIFFGQKYNDYSYISNTNKYSKLVVKNLKNKSLKSTLITINQKKCNLLLKKIKNEYLKTNCNIINLSFAYEIVKKYNVSNSIIIKALNKFKGLPHRQKIVFFNSKVKCIDDSKATSFDASLQSLKSYDKIYWIVGGLPKTGDSFDLSKVSKKIVKAYIVGKNISFFVKKIKKKIPYKISISLKNAINEISKDIKKNKTSCSNILLSPAAASYDQYKNFEDRGDHFKNLIIKKFKKY